MSARRFIFHARAEPTLSGDATSHYQDSNQPTIALDELFDPANILRRHEAQRAALPEPDLSGSPDAPSALFGDDLERFCRAYVIRRLLVEDERETLTMELAPLGNAPPRGLDAWPALTAGRLEKLGSPQGAAKARDEVLYLFHVIVALEWIPTPQRLRRLQWAFRRASDYLYDVSNGTMAFGQVTFGGPEWMQGADIQILASNRFLPRSWVSGLLERHKYTPIRLGRGLWVRDRRIVIDWDEPEGYRAIVHEWAHYALGLKDGYVATRSFFLEPGSTRLTKIPSDLKLPVVLPNRRVKSESIMASVQGNSELANPLVCDAGSNLGAVLSKHYPHMLPRLGESWSGPGALPLPLPHFRLAGELARGTAPTEVLFALPADQARAATGPVVLQDEDGIPTDRWEIFLTRLKDGVPTHLIYQGELDARALGSGFTLLGAAQEDTVLLMSSAGPLQVWACSLDATSANAGTPPQQRWQRLHPAPVTPGAGEAQQQLSEERQTAKLVLGETEAAPGSEAPDPVGPRLIAAPPDVLPVTPPQPEGMPLQKAQAEVKLHGAGAAPGATETLGVSSITIPAPELVHTVFGIGDPKHASAASHTSSYRLPSLDGYVVSTVTPSVSGGLPDLVISDFSQGGPPGTAPSMVSDPIAAGAASGDALLLCDVGEPQKQAEAYRVVTTVLRGAPLPEGTQALSPVFSVATNIPLLESFKPSLLIVNAFNDEGTLDDVRICRVESDGLKPLPTYIAAGGAYAVAPLLARPEEGGKTELPREQCSSLVVDAPEPPASAQQPRFERFVLARVPAGDLRGERPAQSA